MTHDKRLRHILCGSLLAACCTFTLQHSANAAGFYIQEQSVSGLGAAFAGQVATARDSSIIYFNPAGMTDLDGRQANVGAHTLLPSAKWRDTGSTSVTAPVGGLGGNAGDNNPYDVAVVPNLSVAYPVSIDEGDFWFGFAITAPFGLKNKYENDWFGRYDSLESNLRTIHYQPSIAFKFHEDVSFGFGVDLQNTKAILKGALPAVGVVPSAATDGLQDFEGEDWSIGWNAGLIYEPWDHTKIGLHYRSSVEHSLDGVNKVTGLTGAVAGLNGETAGEFDLNLPSITSVGFNHKLSEKWRLLGQFIWFGWEKFDVAPLTLSTGAVSLTNRHYDDSFAASIGREYDWDDALTLRAGYQFDQTPTSDTFRPTSTPDGDRNWLSGGATYHINDRFSLDFAATYITVEDANVNLRKSFYNGLVQVDVNGETRDNSVGIVAFGLNMKF